MKIGFAGPIDVQYLGRFLDRPEAIPNTYTFALTSHLVEAYLEAGHQVHVFASRKEGMDAETVTLEGPTLRVTVFPESRKMRGIPDLWRKERRQMSKAMIESGVEVLHLHWTYEFAMAGLDSKLPHVMTAHDVPTRIWKWSKPYAYWIPRLAMGVYAGRRAQILTAPSPYAVDTWQHEMGRRGETVLVPNALPESIFATYKQQRSIPSVLTFATISNGFGGRKNTATLILAYQELRQKFPGSRLLLFGSGHGPGEEAEAFARERGRTDGMEFVGNISHGALLKRLYDECSVYVHPAREESFSMAVLEAQALSLPVVAAKSSGGPPWLLDGGSAGTLYNNASDHRELAKAMEFAVTRPQAGLQAVAQTRLREIFALAKVRDSYLALLSKALTKK